jgi:hypothetical protein
MAAVDSASWYGLVHDYAWERHDRVVDVGGSTGSLLHRILTAAYSRAAAEGGGKRHPARPGAGVLFDRPSVTAEAHKMWDLRAAAAEAAAVAAAAAAGKAAAKKGFAKGTAAAAAALAAEVERNATLAVEFVPGDFLAPPTQTTATAAAGEKREGAAGGGGGGGSGLPHGRDGDVYVL